MHSNSTCVCFLHTALVAVQLMSMSKQQLRKAANFSCFSAVFKASIVPFRPKISKFGETARTSTP